VPVVRASTTNMNRTEQRLQRAVQARLEPDEHLVAWTPAWVSRYRRFHYLLALRNRDFAVVTDRRLMLWSTGFFTRHPKRRVLAERLDEVSIETTSRDPGRRMACTRTGRPPLLLELGKDPQSDRFSIELRDRALAAKAVARPAAVRATPAPDERAPDEFGVFAPPPAPPAAEEAALADAHDEPRDDAVPPAPVSVSEPASEPAAASDAEPAPDAEPPEPSAPPSDLRPWP
jgi:hypothetical protein